MVGAAVAAGVGAAGQAQRRQVGIEQVDQERLQVGVGIVGDQLHVLDRAGLVVGHVQLQHADHVAALRA